MEKIQTGRRLPNVDDFTFYLDAPSASRLFAGDAQEGLTWEGECHLEGSDRRTSSGAARIMACSCYKGKYWSITARQKKSEFLQPFNRWAFGKPGPTSFAPNQYTGSKDDLPYLNSFDELCEPLNKLIFPQHSEHAGMVIVTGATGSGKSNVVRGLIDKYLTQKDRFDFWRRRERNPHVVSFEDPVEKLLLKSPQVGSKHWLDYTPREKGHDCRNLKSAIRSALRQTPALFHVGEVRDMSEWKQLLEFAGTGHLIFTTAHAGSLVEAMGKIFSATRANHAARRAIVASRLLALVHITRDQITDEKKTITKNVLVPALWRQTVGGAKALMAEGQSSLLPHRGPESEEDDGVHSCFGRRWFGGKLWKHSSSRIVDEIKAEGRTTSVAKSTRNELGSIFLKRCVEWDLEGV